MSRTVLRAPAPAQLARWRTPARVRARSRPDHNRAALNPYTGRRARFFVCGEACGVLYLVSNSHFRRCSCDHTRSRGPCTLRVYGVRGVTLRPGFCLLRIILYCSLRRLAYDVYRTWLVKRNEDVPTDKSRWPLSRSKIQELRLLCQLQPRGIVAERLFALLQFRVPPNAHRSRGKRFFTRGRCTYRKTLTNLRYRPPFFFVLTEISNFASNI